MEERYDYLEECFEKKVENEMDLTKNYVDDKIDAFQKHGISANALEDIANLQHSVFKIHSQIEIMKEQVQNKDLKKSVKLLYCLSLLTFFKHFLNIF